MLASILKFEIMCLLLPTKTFSCNISIISATVNYMTFELEYDQNHYKRAKNISLFHQHLCRLKWCFPLEIVQLLLPTVLGEISHVREAFLLPWNSGSRNACSIMQITVWTEEARRKSYECECGWHHRVLLA